MSKSFTMLLKEADVANIQEIQDFDGHHTKAAAVRGALNERARAIREKKITTGGV